LKKAFWILINTYSNEMKGSTELVYQFKKNGINFVIDVNSGSIHLTDNIVYQIIEMQNQGIDKEKIYSYLKEEYDIEVIKEALSEVEELTEQNQLFTEDPYQNVVKSFKDRESVVKALCLHVAHDCNLACKYCFAEEGEYHKERGLMSSEVGKKAIDFLIENSGSRKNLEIDFFGGEPLMNFDVVKEVVYYAKSKEEEHDKNFRFTITTNGVLLNDEIIEFINEHMYNVVISIDGRKEVHDKMRVASNGKGSYDLILPKLIQVAESRNQENYYARGTFTRNNLDFSKDVLHLADLGFKQISVEPVVAPENMSYALQNQDIEGICREYDLLAEKILEYHKEGKDFNFFHFMIDLEQGPCVIKRMTGCGAGTEYLAVAPEGDLYPCHQFVGIDDKRIGSVYTGIENQKIRQEFLECNLFTKNKCSECWARFYCGGGCNANSYNFHGNISEVYELGCELEKKRVECAIYLKAMGI